MSHLGENLASKGYVVVSIDHPESTYDDLKAFGSTLYNRPFDQLFVLNEMARLGAAGSGSPLAGRVDASRTAILGYSMGGYGVVNVVGGGYRDEAAAFPAAPPNGLLRDRAASNPAYPRRDSTRASRPPSPSGPGGCTPAIGTPPAWPASARRCSSWPAASTTFRATRRARGRSSTAPSTATATC